MEDTSCASAITVNKISVNLQLQIVKMLTYNKNRVGLGDSSNLLC